MSAVPKTKLSIDEYIEFDKCTEGKWEYFAGDVVDMAGASLNHNRITRNILNALARQLQGLPCEVLPSDMRVKVPAAQPYRYPDVVVVCGEPLIETLQGQEMLVNPQMIVEVLSENTEGYDRGLKFTAYQSISSFREYLLVSQNRPYISQYVRNEDGKWFRMDFLGMENTIRFSTLSCEMTFGEIYDRVTFSQDTEPGKSEQNM